MRRLDRVERRLGLLQRRPRSLQLLLGDRLVLGDVVDESLGLVSHFLHLGLDGLGLPRAPRHLDQDLEEGEVAIDCFGRTLWRKVVLVGLPVG